MGNERSRSRSGWSDIISILMGKIKTKYPLEIELDFMLFLESSELIRENYSCVLESGDLEYLHLD